MNVVGYPQPGKKKSWVLVDAFIAGCGGRVEEHPPAVPEFGAAVAFWGVSGIEHLLRQARAEQRDWYYGDNAFFDCTRQRYFRWARNEFQLQRSVAPDFDRLRACGVAVKPWTRSGSHILIVEQSEYFMGIVGARNWLLRATLQVKGFTDRPIRVRRWTANKAKASATLRHDLNGAWAVITHSSSAAVEAVLAGVPVFTSGPCAATPMSSGELTELERPRRPDGVEDWAAGLAARQWTIDEIRAGMAWRALQEC